MLWFPIIIFALISLVFLLGRGGFLITGNDIVGKDGKKPYDEKKLCRVIGGCMSVITLLMLARQLGGDYFPILRHMMAPGICLAAVVMVILNNTIGKNPDYQPVAKTAAEKKKARFRLIGTALVLTALIGGTLIFLFTGEITVSRGEDGLHIAATYWRNKTIAYDAIDSVIYLDSSDSATRLDLGNRTAGYGGFKAEMGKFRNETFGDYTLYAYKGCKSYVILETTEGTVVVNAANEESTRQLYQDILSQHTSPVLRTNGRTTINILKSLGPIVP